MDLELQPVTSSQGADTRHAYTAEVLETRLSEAFEMNSHWASCKTVRWTTIDEKKIKALDNLHTRSREYHNQVRSVTGIKTFAGDPPSHDETAFSYRIFDISFPTDNHLLDVQFSECRLALSKLSLSESSVIWVHVEHIEALETLKARFGIHELFGTFFSDFRAHSSFMSLPNGFLLSMCMHHWSSSGDVAVIKKFWAYLSPKVIITVSLYLDHK